MDPCLDLAGREFSAAPPTSIAGLPPEFVAVFGHGGGRCMAAGRRIQSRINR